MFSRRYLMTLDGEKEFRLNGLKFSPESKYVCARAESICVPARIRYRDLPPLLREFLIIFLLSIVSMCTESDRVAAITTRSATWCRSLIMLILQAHESESANRDRRFSRRFKRIYGNSLGNPGVDICSKTHSYDWWLLGSESSGTFLLIWE